MNQFGCDSITFDSNESEVMEESTFDVKTTAFFDADEEKFIAEKSQNIKNDEDERRKSIRSLLKTNTIEADKIVDEEFGEVHDVHDISIDISESMPISMEPKLEKNLPSAPSPIRATPENDECLGKLFF